MLRRDTEKERLAGGAGLGPAGAVAGSDEIATAKEGAHGGTMGSPMFSPDYFTLD